MNRQGRMLVSGAFLSSQRIFEYGYVPVTVSEMPVPQLSHKSRNGPITAICGGRPAMTRKKLPIKKKKSGLRWNGKQPKCHAHCSSADRFFFFRVKLVFARPRLPYG